MTARAPSVGDGRASSSALVCRARERRCALPLEHVVETMRPLPVQPLAHAPSFVLGVSVVRGAPLAVVDLGALLTGAGPADPARFVTVRTGEGRVALAVEGVEGVVALPGGLRALPRLLGEAAGDAVTAVGILDAELLLVLEAARLVPPPFEGAPEPGSPA